MLTLDLLQGKENIKFVTLRQGTDTYVGHAFREHACASTGNAVLPNGMYRLVNVTSDADIPKGTIAVAFYSLIHMISHFVI